MGILNMTEDSFYDGGKFFKMEDALNQAKVLIAEGADLIDIGAESSRPFAKPISGEFEKKQIVTVIQRIRQFSNIPISVDTVRSETAQAALEVGANMINDISAMKSDPNMVRVIADFQVPVVLMHMRGNPQTMQLNTEYEDIIQSLQDFFDQRIEYAMAHQVDPESIILDPGICFGKSLEGNLKILKNLYQLHFDCPFLIGTSRKSFIGKILNCEVSDRLIGSLASLVPAFHQGVKFFRVHDVAETREFLTMLDYLKVS